MNNLSTRQFQALVLTKLEEQNREIRQIRKVLDDKLDAVLVSPKNAPIPRPIQGKNTKRSTNVTRTMRAEIEARNKLILEGSGTKSTAKPSLYLEFPHGIPDTRLNSDAMRVIESVLRLRLDPGWETMRWNEIYNRDKRKGELIIQEASRMPDLAVFSQASNQWAIRMLAEQRTYTIQKTVRKSTAGNTSKNKSKYDKTTDVTVVDNFIDNQPAQQLPSTTPQDQALSYSNSVNLDDAQSKLSIDMNHEAVDVVPALSVDTVLEQTDSENSKEDQPIPIQRKKTNVVVQNIKSRMSLPQTTLQQTEEIPRSEPNKTMEEDLQSNTAKETPTTNENTENILRLLSEMDAGQLQKITEVLSGTKKKSDKNQSTTINNSALVVTRTNSSKAAVHPKRRGTIKKKSRK